MYVCKNCGELFESPVTTVETYGFDYPPYKTVFVCPECGDDDYVSTKPCSMCDEYITDEFVRLRDNRVVCSNCYVLRNINRNHTP